MSRSDDAWVHRIRQIAFSHRMDRRDIVEACRLGGLEISASRADSWKRGESRRNTRVKASQEEFDAFLDGLVQWASEAYAEK